jgi:hypothetical protein
VNIEEKQPFTDQPREELAFYGTVQPLLFGQIFKLVLHEDAPSPSAVLLKVMGVENSELILSSFLH